MFLPAAVWITTINFVKRDRRGVSQQVGLPAMQEPRSGLPEAQHNSKDKKTEVGLKCDIRRHSFKMAIERRK